MDHKDEAILQVLERKSKLSSRAIAKIVKLPISTVNRRIRRLEKEEVIKGYRAIIDYEKTRRPIGAYLFINIHEIIPEKGHIPKSIIVKKLLKYHQVVELVDVQGGRFDLVIKARFSSLRALSGFVENLREVHGIEELFSAIITEELLQT